MRKEFQYFAIMFLVVFIISLVYNLNKAAGYPLFDRKINGMLYGLSVSIPLNFLAFKMCREAKFLAERVICKSFLWVTLSGLADELFFDPCQFNWHEHLVATILLLFIILYEKSRGKLFG